MSEAKAAVETSTEGGDGLALVRRVLAILALLGLGGLVAAMALPQTVGGVVGVPTIGRDPESAWLLLAPIVLALVGLVANLYWSRWLGIAVALAVVPWAGVATFAVGPASPLALGGAIALGCAALLLVSLFGSAMIARFEGRMAGADWTGPRMRLLRWTVIGNLVSVLTLFLFMVAYQFRVALHLGLLAGTMAGLVLGIVLLARQKTAGLLLVWLCSVLFLPAGGYFIQSEAANAGEAMLLAAAFLPGLLTGWATVFVFGKPVWRYLRS